MDGKDIKSDDMRDGPSASDPRAILHPVSEIDANLVEAWTDLAEQASEPNIFYERWFLRPGLTQFGQDPDIKLFLLWAGEPGQSQLLGLLPLGVINRFGRLPVAHVQNWMHHNCFLGTPLVRTGFERLFWEQLLRALDRSDWPGFLHINGMTVGGPLDQALRAVCGAQKRHCDLVHSKARALLEGECSSEEYYRTKIRKKKRKELLRKQRRLGETGDLQFSQHQDMTGLDDWIDEFLALERDGWKGKVGSALDCTDATRAFFRSAMHGAAESGQLERRDMRLDGKPITMLINLLSGRGGFGFKTAFDESYSRYSPGVLLQIENLDCLDRETLDWVDSCASEGHPMIDGLWTDRRHIGRFSIALNGLPRRARFRLVRFAEALMGKVKGRKIVDPMEAQQ
ncbi:GNAT family N-acetyltransferase [Parasphingorhabdus sp.]|uniref:GNAT family N-acetyltransferase n=1 Tax=Parasphingorhabdus sp. TaxID=2709688 RepID=UPI003265016A